MPCCVLPQYQEQIETAGNATESPASLFDATQNGFDVEKREHFIQHGP